jgi:hypothetical protein
MKKLFYSAIVGAFVLTSCGPDLCECVNMDKDEVTDACKDLEKEWKAEYKEADKDRKKEMRKEFRDCKKDKKDEESED